ncbi:MAG: hypothetical protein D4S01_00605 [Dehalococcoidia bacterium]|nr:MAG: hypothetical protein D4S01_00605 [Dehalococcoidia bacterium]
MSLVGQLLRFGINISNEQMEVYPHLIANGGLSVAMGRGRVYYVDPANGSDSNDGKTPRRALATIEAGYAKLVTNRHDTLVYLAGATTATLTASITWSKSYTHFVGVCAPTNVSQRARIISSAAITPLITISGTGCIFKNLAFKQEYSHATAGCVLVSGGRNYFENVHFAGQLGALAKAGANAYSLKLDGAEENLFVGCTIGVDTVALTAGKPLWFDGAAVRNEFRDCNFTIASDTNTVEAVVVNDTTALDRSLIFKRCFFYNFSVDHATTLLQVFDIPTGMQTCDIILSDCYQHGFAEWATGDRGNIWVYGAVAVAGTAGVGSSGTMIEPS